MTFNQIRYFITLAESLSYTEAAKHLFITQPNLSRQIRAMEEELGIDLFVRHTRSIKLTPAGTLLYKRFNTLLSDYNSAISEALNASTDYDGHLTVGILDIYDFQRFYPSLISNVQNAHPNLDLKIKRRSLGALLDDIQNHHVDLILTYGFSLYDYPDLVTVNVGTFDSCIMLPKNHPLCTKKDITLADLRDETFVQLNPSISSEGSRYLDALLFHAGIHPRIRSVDTMNDVMLYVESGNAVAITSNCSMERYNPNVTLMPMNTPEAKGHTITFAWLKDNFNPAIATFMEQVEKTFES